MEISLLVDLFKAFFIYIEREQHSCKGNDKERKETFGKNMKKDSRGRDKGSLMVHILNGNSEKGAHVRSTFCFLISFRHLTRKRTVANPIFSSS